MHGFLRKIGFRTLCSGRHRHEASLIFRGEFNDHGLRVGLSGIAVKRETQHSIIFSASPARLVSLYRDCISIPVWYIVSITWSSDSL